MACEDLERKGNTAFGGRDYKAAIELYSSALQLTPANATLLSKRAKVYIELQEYELAAADAEASLTLYGGQDRKTQFRLSTALYGLSRYEEASSELHRLQSANNSGKRHVSPTNQEIEEFAKRVELRIQENVHGKYDLFTMLKEAKAMATPYLDHADYVGPVRVTEVEGKDRGMVATKNISAGTLIMCCKAYAVAFDQEHAARFGSDIVSYDPDELLITKVVERMQRHPGTVADVYSLLAGPDMLQLDISPEAKKELPIDVSRVEKIVKYCNFLQYVDCLGDLWLWPLYTSDVSSESSEQIRIFNGLWILPSFFNHSCLANARHYFLGDFIFIRAINDIAEGEEISLAYSDPFDYYSTKDRLFGISGFLCECSLCSFARAHPQIAELRTLWTKCFEKRIELLFEMGDYTLLPQLNQIIMNLRETFQNSRSPGSESGIIIPPLELFNPLKAKALVHFIQREFEDAVSPFVEAFELLPRLGNSPVNAVARIDIALHLSDIYMALGNPSEMEKWATRARAEFNVMFDESEDLWQMYIEETAPASAMGTFRM
ncbi:hypothetical protein R1flu_029081 [Riccia fluitans]|uniref:SET domain-containing protein n=1 Tax=Riccia fluitans TaxID=41844 RepID=A0ABD1XNI0_9MARC